MEKVTPLVVAYVPKVLLAILILIIGFFLIGKVVNLVEKAIQKHGSDPSLATFLGGLTRWILRILLLISVASMVGIATTSFVAVIGAAGLAIGLALQGSLANFAGGVLILIFKPFKTGDYIIAQGEEGTVKKVDVFATILTKLDNRRIILPNGPLAGGTIVNVTAEDVRRVDLSIGIGYGDSIPKALEVLKKMCELDSRVLKEPEVFVGVTDYGDSSINLTLRSWVKQDDYWDVFFDLSKSVKPTLDEAGISIPFPQRDVHLFNEK